MQFHPRLIRRRTDKWRRVSRIGRGRRAEEIAGKSPPRYQGEAQEEEEPQVVVVVPVGGLLVLLMSQAAGLRLVPAGEHQGSTHQLLMNRLMSNSTRRRRGHQRRYMYSQVV
jgi:hypothetical protein